MASGGGSGEPGRRADGRKARHVSAPGRPVSPRVQRYQSGPIGASLRDGVGQLPHVSEWRTGGPGSADAGVYRIREARHLPDVRCNGDDCQRAERHGRDVRGRLVWQRAGGRSAALHIFASADAPAGPIADRLCRWHARRNRDQRIVENGALADSAFGNLRGETYDARLEQPGWSQARFADAG